MHTLNTIEIHDAPHNIELEQQILGSILQNDKLITEMANTVKITAFYLDEQLEVTCKVGEDEYEKHFLGLSDNISYMVLQLETVNVSEYHYKIYLRPETLIPDIELDVK